MSDFFDGLNDLSSVEALITNAIRESEVLEYKSAEKAFGDKEKDEIPKDVTGMANSLGGVIIYGISTDKDDKTKPVAISGLESKNIESLDRVINSRIRPPIAGLKKKLIPESDPKVMVLYVPESQDPPHQSLVDKRYYRRSGSECLPMEHDLVALKFGRLLSPILDLEFHPLSAPTQYEGNPAWTGPAEIRISTTNTGRRVGRDVLVFLRFPESSKVKILEKDRNSLVNIDDLHKGYQARQRLSQMVYHPGTHVVEAVFALQFAEEAASYLADAPIIEWTLYADEMQPRVGVVTLKSLGWTLPA